MMPRSVNGSPNGDTVREGRPAPTRETGVCVTRATCAPWKGTQFWSAGMCRDRKKPTHYTVGPPGARGCLLPPDPIGPKSMALGVLKPACFRAGLRCGL